MLGPISIPSGVKNEGSLLRLPVMGRTRVLYRVSRKRITGFDKTLIGEIRFAFRVHPNVEVP